MKVAIPTTSNKYGYTVVDWDHWSVRLRVWLGDLSMPVWLWSRLERAGIIIYGDSEDCWVGGYPLGEDD